MPDIKPSLNEDTMDRLASLSEQINTSKGFGMMGLMQQEQAAALQQMQESQAPQAQPTTTSAAPAAQDNDPDKVPAWLDPLNQSFRAIAETTSREIGSLRNELSTLRQPVQPAGEEAGEVDPVAQKLGSIEQTLMKTKLDTAWERARNSLNAAKIKHGNDFNFTEDDLRNVWQTHIGRDVSKAENTNWDVYMQQQYDSRRAPALEKRLKELEGKLATQATDPMAAMAAMPRANRNGAPTPAGGVVNDFDEDVYRKATARMGKRIGSFQGFNRLLVEEQNKKMLRTAS